MCSLVQALLAVLVPVAVLLLLCLAALLWRYRRMMQKLTRQTHAQQAPGVGPLTTLLITDIGESRAGRWGGAGGGGGGAGCVSWAAVVLARACGLC
jgi:hypothetical protein